MIAALPAALLAAAALATPVERLNAELLSHNSATAVLQTRCATRIHARQLSAVEDPAATAAARRDLHVGPAEPLRHRRVELMCGAVVFSRADNWYLPARLTPGMNTRLDTTETPFGVVVRPLRFQRYTILTKILVKPGAPPPPEVLQHRAALATPDGRPFSLVVETYAREVLAP